MGVCVLSLPHESELRYSHVYLHSVEMLSAFYFLNAADGGLAVAVVGVESGGHAIYNGLFWGSNIYCGMACL